MFIKSTRNLAVLAFGLFFLAVCLAVTMLVLVSIGLSLPIVSAILLVGASLLTAAALALWLYNFYRLRNPNNKLNKEYDFMEENVNRKSLEVQMAEKVAENNLILPIQTKFNQFYAELCSEINDIVNGEQVVKSVAFDRLNEQHQIFIQSEDVSIYWQATHQENLSLLSEKYPKVYAELNEKYQELKEFFRQLNLRLVSDTHRIALADQLSTGHELLKNQGRTIESISAFLANAVGLYGQMLKSEMVFENDYEQLRQKFIAVIREEWYELCKLYYTDSKQDSFGYFDFLYGKTLLNQHINLTNLITIEAQLIDKLPNKVLVFPILKKELIAVEEDLWNEVKKFEENQSTARETPTSINFIELVKVVDNFFTVHHLSPSARAIYLTKLKDYLLNLAEKEPEALNELSKHFYEPDIFIKIKRYDWGKGEGKDIRAEFFNELLALLNPVKEIIKPLNTDTIVLTKSQNGCEDVSAFCHFTNQMCLSVKGQLKNADKEGAQIILKTAFAELKEQYRTLALKYHPDKNRDIAPDQAKFVFQTINEIQERAKQYLGTVIEESASFIELNQILKEMIIFYQESNREILTLIERFEQRTESLLEESDKELEIVKGEIKVFENKADQEYKELAESRKEMQLTLQNFEAQLKLLTTQNVDQVSNIANTITLQ